MDQTFLQLVSLIVSLSNQMRDLQVQNAELLAAKQKAQPTIHEVLETAESA